MDESNRLLSIQNKINETIDQIGFGRYQFIMISCFLIINLALGRDNATSSIVIFILEGEWDLSESEISILGGSSLFGMAIGFILSLSLEEKYGRLICIKCSIVMMITFEFALGFMVEMWGFAVLRVLIGISNGLYYGFIFSLAVEQTPSKNRGQASLLVSTGGFMGFLLVLIVIFIFIPDLEGNEWRYAVLLPLVILIPNIPVLFIFVVESPLYLIRKGKYDKAVENLNWIAKTNNEPELSETEIEEIKEMPLVEFEPLNERVKRFFDTEWLKVSLKTFSVVPLIFFVYFGIIFHLPYLFEDEGAENEYIVLYYLGLTGLTVALFFSTLVFIEKETFGRKKIMIALLTGVFLVIGVALFVEDIYWVSSLLILAASMTAVASGISLLITGEAFETNLRATALILVNCVGRLISSTALYLLLLLLTLGYWAPLLFLEVIILFIIVISFTIEDNTGATLDNFSYTEKESERVDNE